MQNMHILNQWELILPIRQLIRETAIRGMIVGIFLEFYIYLLDSFSKHVTLFVNNENLQIFSLYNVKVKAI
jgi:hypothetical protein